ncbi:BgTH12-06120 [Blumeria graminis f. sp. triticale]|uniref:ribonuclease H n=3 Tax=Blumeria graminis TaxID=34373 RepID=A0A9X9MKY4_BLUGR|nr:ribonuclease [Blumeria graminis f. sp. tritici 96224]CAD6504390.1 BgTH12-06120 [Blumeria graminis f. sp. triticale]VDB91219.1 Bgt-4082 [Blumeria graminis f. sp. tritici]
MVYKMNIYADGTCRGNGKPGSTAAAAAVFQLLHGRQTSYTCLLPKYPNPTNQRAELTGMIIALEEAIERHRNLRKAPMLSVRIFTDSKYVIGCLNEWLQKWRLNGWTNAAGRMVANRDLIEKASNLVDELNKVGTVEYVWIPREENFEAREACNEVLDEANYI